MRRFAFLAVFVVGCSSSSSGSSPAGSGGAGGGASEAPIPTGTALTIDSGPVAGATDGKVRSWKGIPFAAPPTGMNRFRVPQPVAAWTDPRDATKLGDECPQPNVLNGGYGGGSEDCLFLNVYSPDPAPKTGAPVLVWFHGGAFILGSAGQALYDGTDLVSRTGAVVVTVNYRLGALGFLSHAALAKDNPNGEKGNWGLYDQRAAMAWVQRNIHQFGGDASSITIFGESAGGFSVSAHLTSPDSAPYFQRAIVESGSLAGFDPQPAAAAEQQAGDLATALGCTGDVIACLRGKSPTDLVVGLKNPSPLPGGLFEGTVRTAVWFPANDGVFFPISPTEAFATGKIAKVPIILGSNKAEGALFHSGILGDVPVTDQAGYDAALKRTFGDLAPMVVARYPLASFAKPDDALAQIETDAAFTCAARRQARALTKAGAPVYRYFFTRKLDAGAIAALGPTHSAELAYLWGTSDVTFGKVNTDESMTLTPIMQDYWTSLAKSGDPNGNGSPTWPKYDVATDPYLTLDVPPVAGAGLATELCDFWDGLPALTLPKSY
jgi:para-nitrobenzyl esterase